MKLTFKSRKLDPNNSSIIQPHCDASHSLYTMIIEGKINRSTPAVLLPYLMQTGYNTKGETQSRLYEIVNELVFMKELSTKIIPVLLRLGYEVCFSEDSETKELHYDLEREGTEHTFSKDGKITFPENK